jgi:tetratricopeptide (TPR) repeat protein
MVFRRRSSYSRLDLMDDAARAAARGRLRKAIAGYSRVLDVDPLDFEAHSRVAPLFARTGEVNKSWTSYRLVAETYLQKGFHAKAAGVYVQATKHMPKKKEVWENLCEVYLMRDLKADAVDALFHGHRNFKGRYRDTAIRLLEKARQIEPWKYNVTKRLARLLRKSGRKGEALSILEGLAAREKGKHLRKVRGDIFTLSPGLSTAWLWMKAAIKGR